MTSYTYINHFKHNTSIHFDVTAKKYYKYES